MGSEDLLNKIAELCKQRKGITIAETAAELGINWETARRNMQILAAKQPELFQYRRGILYYLPYEKSIGEGARKG